MRRDSLASAGRIFVGTAFVAFGLLHLVHGDFVTRVVPSWPDWMPARTLAACLVGLFLVGAGAAIVANRRMIQVASFLGSLLLLSFVTLALPLAASDAPWGGLWTVAGKTLALGGGAFLIAQRALASANGPMALLAHAGRLWSLGPWFFGAFLTLCGIQHFVHDVFVATLVPAWIPGAMFWTYFAGVALVAGGTGVVVPQTARLAGLLSGAMIFVWLIVLHIPRALDAATRSTNETTAVFEALAMSGIGFLIGSGTTGTSGTTDTTGERNLQHTNSLG